MKSQQTKRAYCFLVSNEVRDFYLLIPFIYYLEKYEGFKVTFEFIWDVHKIRKRRPDLVILPNVRGHLLYYQVAKYCNENDILVFCNDSEGNFNTEIDYDFWGFNADGNNFCPVHFTWNQRVKDFLVNKYHLSPSTIKISGAPNFDRYQYLKKPERNLILKKYNLDNYSKVVGYAGWAFGKLFNTEINDLLSNLQMEEASGKVWLQEQRDFVERCLRLAIERHPDILFILKKHPRENFESDYRDSRNEMNRLTKYPNVLYLKDEEEIQDLIAIADLWMTFESTTTIEAWLMGIPTLIINQDTDFNRAELYKGSKIAFSEKDVLNALNELYINQNKSYFNSEDVISRRQAIITNSIGFADGLNHLRCANYFKPYLEILKRSKGKPKLHLKFVRLYYLLHIGKFFYVPSLFKRLPKFKKTIWVFENYRLQNIKNQKDSVYADLDRFYNLHDLDSKIRSGKLWDEFN